MGWDGMGYVIHLCASLNGFMQCQTLRRPLLVVVVLCESVGKFRGDGQLREGALTRIDAAAMRGSLLQCPIWSAASLLLHPSPCCLLCLLHPFLSGDPERVGVTATRKGMDDRLLRTINNASAEQLISHSDSP